MYPNIVLQRVLYTLYIKCKLYRVSCISAETYRSIDIHTISEAYQEININASPSTSLHHGDFMARQNMQWWSATKSQDGECRSYSGKQPTAMGWPCSEGCLTTDFHAELTEGQRKRGCQKQRYRDVLKRYLKAADIDTDS